MHKISINIEMEGGKITVFGLKTQIEKLLSQFSCHYNIDISDDRGLHESISASITAIEVPTEEVIDLSLSGDQMYELITEEQKKLTNGGEHGE